MRKHWLARVLKFGIFAVLFLALFTFFVMNLWNWLMPALFGWHVITYWQALGILILSKILFGGLRHGSHGRWHWKKRMMERWEHMTPEEREKFRASMRGRCGPFGPPAAENKA